MRTLVMRNRWFIAAAVSVVGCSRGAGDLGFTGPSITAEAAFAVSGSWSGTFVESRPALKRDRTGQLRLSLQQSGDRVSGSGVSQGSICLPARYAVTGVVSGSSIRLSFADGGDPPSTVSADGRVTGNLIEAAYASPRSVCDEIDGTFSLTRD